MKKIVKALALLAVAAVFVGCKPATGGSTGGNAQESQPSGTQDSQPAAPAASATEEVVLTEKYVAWSQLSFKDEYAKLTDAQKATAKVVIEVTGATGVKAGWGYGKAYIWHSWIDGDSSEPESLSLTAPADATETGFTVEWTAAQVLAEYNPASDAGLGLNFWGAIKDATIKVKLVYTK